MFLPTIVAINMRKVVDSVAINMRKVDDSFSALHKGSSSTQKYSLTENFPQQFFEKPYENEVEYLNKACKKILMYPKVRPTAFLLMFLAKNIKKVGKSFFQHF